MSVKLINDFRMKIYKLLSEDGELSNKLDRVYLFVVPDAKYPFISVNLINSEKTCVPRAIFYEVEFDISFFSRDKNKASADLITERVADLLNIKALRSVINNIVGINTISVTTNQSADFITNKTSIRYKALLK